jgi:hypothetical protein
MRSEPVEVESYSGGRADERPRSVTIGVHKHAVAHLLSESIEESDADGLRERRRRYRVLTEDGLVLELIRTDNGCWFLSLP